MEKSTNVVLILSLCLFSFMVSTEGREVRTTKPQQAYEPQTFPGFNGIFGNPQPGSGLGPVFGLGRSIPGLPGPCPAPCRGYRAPCRGYPAEAAAPARREFGAGGGGGGGGGDDDDAGKVAVAAIDGVWHQQYV
uniref:Uncharacterized protein n=1 Tax=Ananas comosus var. bracteatus TaxID=296719 RepID=A0A6V7PSN8_ANACO|nr:unnamed protein product [Ananas comosus var. bracteatus]